MLASKYFDDLDDKSAPIDAMEEWLSTPVVNTHQDPIEYWTTMQKAGNLLAAMALDFLSIPGAFFIYSKYTCRNSYLLLL